MNYSDEELLKLVAEERRRSIGFGDTESASGDLQAARQQALAYYKGQMADVPALNNRSRVVDTAVRDAIETVMPDLMEVFIGGEDVATFQALGAEDEEKAKEETEFVRHVVFTENEGFLTLHSAIKDACLTRTGVIHFWWEDEEKDEPAGHGSAEIAELLAAQMQMGGQEVQSQAQEDGTVSLSISALHGKVKIKAVPSEDFTIAADAVSVRDASYCAMRSRERVQDLIVRGLDAETVRALPAYAQPGSLLETTRDRAGENYPQGGESQGDLRVVEVQVHYVRLLDGDTIDIWSIVTDAEQKVLLHKEKVPLTPFAAGSPYIVPHRFYGESVADSMLEVQRIKTALSRMMLDSGYFALNQRNYVDMTQSNEFTISDLMANEPGRPVRGRGPGAVTPLGAGALNFDVFAALEYASVVGEQRSGIVRNAQGLNPDTLHDTARGAIALITAAQKRVRMMARIFAETLIKDLFLGVHCLLRVGYTDKHRPMAAQMGGDWKSAEPNKWPERCAVAIHVGVGSAGREHDMMIANERLGVLQNVLGMQGGASGPFADPSNVHNALMAWERSTGSRAPQLYWTDPKNAEPQPPKPDPETEKVKGQLQLAQAKAQADTELAANKHQMDAQAAERKAEQDHAARIAEIQSNAELSQWQAEQELALKRETTAAELDMKRELLTAELQMKREVAMMNAAVAHETGMAKAEASTSVSEVEAGGEPG